MKILVMNAGSSSQKSCLYEILDHLPTQPPVPLWECAIDLSHQQGKAELELKTKPGRKLEIELEVNDRAAAITYMLETLTKGETQVIETLTEIDLVGHRVVHGGQQYRQATLIDPAVKQTIADLARFAPLHNPVNLEGIEAIEQALGANIPQLAVFDTAFHSSLPDAAAIYAGPYAWQQEGIRRYGFHGISHQYCAVQAAQILDRDFAQLKLITCHLGNGCSLAAIENGHSVDTTMGFTPLAGLMMGTRCGDVDPGILIHLLQQQQYSAEQLNQLNHLLNYESGLKGISGISSDMRQISLAIEAGSDRAQLAYAIYLHRLKSQIGAMLASLGGVDALIFTAGVGENHAQLRQDVCAAFAFLGLEIDPEKNSQTAGNGKIDRDIATANSSVRVLVIHTQEDWAIAKECWQYRATNH
ncbi:acetate kinase [Thalassoporum mexicanum PCC 7367]|uniref:acetate kinase n=1 Tax=Thalassoporum mexicanum TaxID=3457544 RepID=UPI00029FD9F5|nr:acetate kinase [Pseudanabaena sp. PCC 7367]AFY71761.1 acetate kinase [Pseudanabaena sp. PCC 7367]